MRTKPGEDASAELMLLLEETVMWLRFMNLPKLREVLLKELDTDAKRRAYDMTDGGKSRREIAQAVGTSDDNVQNWWERWYELAIVKPSKAYAGRPERIVKLEDLGISLKAPAKKDGKKPDSSAESQDQPEGT